MGHEDWAKSPIPIWIKTFIFDKLRSWSLWPSKRKQKNQSFSISCIKGSLIRGKVNHNISFFNWMLCKNTRTGGYHKDASIERQLKITSLPIIRYLCWRLLKISLMIIAPNKNLLNYLEGCISSEITYFYTITILLIRKVNLFDWNNSARGPAEWRDG